MLHTIEGIGNSKRTGPERASEVAGRRGVVCAHGRPEIAPEKHPRALLLQASYSILCARRLMDQFEFNLLFRRVVGLCGRGSGIGCDGVHPQPEAASGGRCCVALSGAAEQAGRGEAFLGVGAFLGVRGR